MRRAPNRAGPSRVDGHRRRDQRVIIALAVGLTLGFLIGLGYGAHYAWPLTEAVYEARQRLTGKGSQP